MSSLEVYVEFNAQPLEITKIWRACCAQKPPVSTQLMPQAARGRSLLYRAASL
ncbi:MAG: hypothetical protein QXR18_10245 [Pyrobaculum sp.]